MCRSVALLAAVAIAASFVTINLSPAAETGVVSSDANAGFVPLQINKSIAIDLPSDVADVLVTNPDIVNVVVRTKTRAYVIAKGLGMTNVYFYDANRMQIGALDIAVESYPIPAETYTAPQRPAWVIQIWRGSKPLSLSCTYTAKLSEGAQCYAAEKEEAGPAPPGVVINNNPLEALRSHQGNRTRTADRLGISVRSLRNKIRTYRRYGESVPEPGSPTLI